MATPECGVGADRPREGESVNRDGDGSFPARTGLIDVPGAGDLATVMAEAAQALHSQETMDEVLDRLVRAACTAIPGVEFAGVSIAHRDSVQTMAATDPLVEEVDRVQYELREGPCLEAMSRHTTLVVNDMRHESRWPRFTARALELGVLSQMGIEVFRDGSKVCGLNLYAGKSEAFDETTLHAATLFAVHAALALDKTITVTNLNEALQTRQTIGQAIGIVMCRYTVDEHVAFKYLARVSQNSNLKLRDVAQGMVDEISQKATETAIDA